MGTVITFPDRTTPAEIRPDGKAGQLRCLGLARDAENPRAVVVVLSRPLTDAELAVFHDGCRQAAPLAEVACRPEEPNS